MYKKIAKSNKKLKKFLLNAVLGIRTPEVFTPRLFSRQHPRPTGHTAYLIKNLLCYRISHSASE